MSSVWTCDYCGGFIQVVVSGCVPVLQYVVGWDRERQFCSGECLARWASEYWPRKATASTLQELTP